jgi:hypothetical protein
MTLDTHTTTARIKSLDFVLEANGITGDPVNLLLLAHTARDLGVNELLVSLMVDEDEPEVARIRAYARVAVQVAARLREQAATVDARELQPAFVVCGARRPSPRPRAPRG